MPCCAISCCAVPFCAIPCRGLPYCAMLCHTVLWCAIPCRAVPYHAVPCHIVPYHAVLCHAVPYRAVLCHAVVYHAMPCHARLCGALRAVLLFATLMSCGGEASNAGEMSAQVSQWDKMCGVGGTESKHGEETGGNQGAPRVVGGPGPASCPPCAGQLGTALLLTPALPTLGSARRPEAACREPGGLREPEGPAGEAREERGHPAERGRAAAGSGAGGRAAMLRSPLTSCGRAPHLRARSTTAQGCGPQGARPGVGFPHEACPDDRITESQSCRGWKRPPDH